MEAVKNLSTLALPSLHTAHLSKPISSLSFSHKKCKLTQLTKSRSTKFNAISPLVSSQPEDKSKKFDHEDEKFDWFSHWYPLMPVCDLDKRAPHGTKVLGLDVVVWWDMNENAWKVFNDRCPHRLAPLSEGRIDQWGRLQCVYHGWCFGGSGDCKLIPQAPLDGPPVHSYSKACVGVYPSTVQNGIVWFWPNTNPQYKDILTKKKPPYIPELDDPSFYAPMFTRDIPYGYEVLIENLMDPAHVPYAHHGIMSIAPQPSVKLDREGGSPMDIKIKKTDKNGFTATEQQGRIWTFVSPCLVQASLTIKETSIKGKLAEKTPQKQLFIFLCIPVSPGNSRFIGASPRNFSLWIDPFASRWMHHIVQNLIIDSDLYLLRVQEEKLMEAGPSNWQKVCFVPTKADTMVTLFRAWLKKYAGGQVHWGTNINGSLPSIPPREQCRKTVHKRRYKLFLTDYIQKITTKLQQKSLKKLRHVFDTLPLKQISGHQREPSVSQGTIAGADCTAGINRAPETLPETRAWRASKFGNWYWSHVVNCSSCTGAYKGLIAVQISFQVLSIAMVAIVAATKQEVLSIATRYALATAAVLCFVGSRWLSRFIYQNFHYHDYNHASK